MEPSSVSGSTRTPIASSAHWQCEGTDHLPQSSPGFLGPGAAEASLEASLCLMAWERSHLGPLRPQACSKALTDAADTAALAFEERGKFAGLARK